jgi:hypothetical protein
VPQRRQASALPRFSVWQRKQRQAEPPTT